MKKQLTKDQIEGYECKHAVYVEHQGGEKKDALIVKELIHLKDGTTVPNVRMIENFQREFYVTKEAARNHEFKKQFEDLDKVMRYTSTQIDLSRNVARALRKNWVPDMRIMGRSQYLYGTDIDTKAIIKHKYQSKFPNCRTLNSVAVGDIESDVVEGHEEIISISLTYKERVAIFVSNWFVRTKPDAIDEIKRKFSYYLGEYETSRKIDLEVYICDSEVETVKAFIAKAHEWQPDFLAFWNMAYDIPKMLGVLERNGYNPADIWSDPRVPPQYRLAKWQPGPVTKITASGRKMALSIAERWNTFFVSAGFYVIDAMCVYQKIRIAAGKEPSYALDAILKKELKLGKLKFQEADHLIGIGWHQFMQKNYKIEYLVYNLFDCISIELLDERNMDLSNKISMLSGCSDYFDFKSQPKRTCNELHWFALEERKKVIGCTSDDMKLELDKYVTNTEGWIVTLPTHLVIDNGLQCIKEFPEIVTKARLHVGDQRSLPGVILVDQLVNCWEMTKAA